MSDAPQPIDDLNAEFERFLDALAGWVVRRSGRALKNATAALGDQPPSARQEMATPSATAVEVELKAAVLFGIARHLRIATDTKLDTDQVVFRARLPKRSVKVAFAYDDVQADPRSLSRIGEFLGAALAEAVPDGAVLRLKEGAHE